MEEKQVKRLPPFTHIKVLENGNYGCTLVVADKIYNGVFSPTWECIEKLHLVEVDAYADFDHKLKDGLNPMLDKDRIDIIYDNDEELAKGLILNFEDDNTIVNEDDTPQALFFSKYENRTGETSLTIENTLLSYKYFIPSFLENIFNKFYCCGCGRIWAGCRLCWDRIEKVFGISLVDNGNPFDEALKKVIKEYQTFDDIAFDKVDELHIDIDISDPIFDMHLLEEIENLEIDFKQRLSNGKYNFCYYGYLKYIIDYCKEYFNVDIGKQALP